jgi:N-acetylgalactosamine kinase
VSPKYPLVTFAAEPTQAVDLSQRSWATYVLCGYKGVHDYLAARGQAAPADGGLDAMVDGRVPTGSGHRSLALTGRVTILAFSLELTQV